MKSKFNPKQFLLEILLFILGGFLIYSSYNIYKYLDNYQTNETTTLETYQFQKQYMKYIERLTLYLHYKDEGYQVDLTGFSNIQDLNDPIDNNIVVSERSSDSSVQEDFDFYNYRLNLQSTNFLYYAINKSTGTVYCSPYLKTLYPDDISQFVDELEQNDCYFSLNTKTGKYATNIDKNSSIFSKSNLSWIVETLTEPISLENGSIETNDYIIYTGVISGFPNTEDEFYSLNENYTKYRSGYQHSLYLFPSCGLLCVLIIILLISNAGKLPKNAPLALQEALISSNGIVLNGFDRIPTEPAAFLIALAVFGLIECYTLLFDQILVNYSAPGNLLLMLLYVTLFPFILLCFLSIVKRLKAKNLWKNSLTRRMFTFLARFGKQFFENHACTYRIALLLFCFILMQFAGIILYEKTSMKSALYIIIAISYLFLSYNLIKQSIDLGVIFRQTRKMQEGDLTIKVPVEHMSVPLNVLGDYINNISDGLSAAVEERIKSERFKTELITNVSHDIKTPLTSIINYIDLLKKENIENESAQKYLEILTTKSWRLKTLIEDLVEASKASVGAIKMEPQRLNLVELARQSTGEYEDRLHNNNLEVIINAPDTPISIISDGRSTYRIIENLLSNANKYAMHGTRIYIDVFVRDTFGVMTVKNISKDKLNITADELMERFVRGDLSRNTEGSGLGLSIARSLASLQNGSFDLDLDGDLFKASISLPLAPAVELLENSTSDCNESSI